MENCDLSEAMAAGVECNRWIWIGLGAFLFISLCALCCVIGYYWESCILRCKRAAQSPVLGSGARAEVLPLGLRVASPVHQTGCAGEYELLADLLANEQPIWKQVGGDRWLYSGDDGRWYIGGPSSKDRRFACSSGFIYHREMHGGVLPHKLTGTWEWSGGAAWHRDPEISVTAILTGRQSRSCTPTCNSRNNEVVGDNASTISTVESVAWPSGTKGPPVLRPYFPHGDVSDSGSSVARDNFGLTLEANPVLQGPVELPPTPTKRARGRMQSWGFKRRDGASETSTEDGGPPLSSQPDSSDASTEQSTAVVSVEALPPPVATRAPASPCRAPGLMVKTEESTRTTPRVNRHLPIVLTVASPNGQRECAGEYDVVPGEMPNGQPLWKQRNGDHWLYSGTTGRWCIGGQDVRDDGFARSAGWISQTAAHRGLMPDLSAAVWQRWDGTQFARDESIMVIGSLQFRNVVVPDQLNLVV